MKRLLVCVFALSACGTKTIVQCTMDSECTENPSLSFCDVNGEYPASGGDHNVCTPVPSECPVERCGCTPGAERCAATTLAVCNADGTTETTTACTLGCATDGTRCADFAPSNGLTTALAMAASEPDADLPATATIDDAGDIQNESTGLTLPIKSLLVSQVGVPAIRVYIARSFKIHDAFVIATKEVGSNPIAFVATGAITIDGKLDGGVDVRFYAPGNQPTGAPCAGVAGGRGGGGGGNGTVGGRGSQKAQLPPAPGAAGGPMQPPDLFEPLVGGCPGGGDGDANLGGQGGVAFELVSATAISVTSTGIVNAAGHGGADDSGGGSGGTVLLEAPAIDISGRIVANGGSGGACGVSGNNGTLDASPAAHVGGCMATNGVNPAVSGAGGTKTQLPEDAQTDASSLRGGGGGGAVGRLEIKTKDGTFAQSSTTIISAMISMGMLEPE